MRDSPRTVGSTGLTRREWVTVIGTHPKWRNEGFWQALHDQIANLDAPQHRAASKTKKKGTT